MYMYDSSHFLFSISSLKTKARTALPQVPVIEWLPDWVYSKHLTKYHLTFNSQNNHAKPVIIFPTDDEVESLLH